MSNPHGQAHHGLRDRPAIQDAGTSPHPAIATNQGADLYDAGRAAGIESAGRDAAKHRVSVSQGKATSGPTKAKSVTESPAFPIYARRLQGRTAKGEAQQSHRVRVADAYLTGAQTIQELAEEHCVSSHTVKDWIRDRRDTFMLDHGARPLGTRRDRMHEPSLVVGVYGAGGTMTDESVRRATQRLEAAILQGLTKRGLRALPYRKEVTA